MIISDHEITESFAYSYWDEAGRPEGRDLEFWLKGEEKLRKIHWTPVWYNMNSYPTYDPNVDGGIPDLNELLKDIKIDLSKLKVPEKYILMEENNDSN